MLDDLIVLPFDQIPAEGTSSPKSNETEVLTDNGEKGREFLGGIQILMGILAKEE